MGRIGSFVVLAILFTVLVLILIYGTFGGDGNSYAYATVESIAMGQENRWNASRVASPAVVYDHDAHVHRMWYVGNGTNGRSGIGYATSTDGVDWTPQADPILITTDAWEAGGFHDVHVLQDGANFRMWYSAGADSAALRIGYATSQDGVHWSRSALNPIVQNGVEGAWNAASVLEPFVLRVGDTWRMWFTGVDAGGVARIGYATSTDGTTWSQAPINPVFSGQGTWDAGGVGGAFVDLQYNGQLYEMWFTGIPKGKNALSSLGRAYSNDGITWAEDTAKNPAVIDDKTAFANPWVAVVESIAYIWTGARVNKPVARETIQFTSWPQKMVDGTQVLPASVPAFGPPTAY